MDLGGHQCFGGIYKCTGRRSRKNLSIIGHVQRAHTFQCLPSRLQKYRVPIAQLPEDEANRIRGMKRASHYNVCARSRLLHFTWYFFARIFSRPFTPYHPMPSIELPLTTTLSLGSEYPNKTVTICLSVRIGGLHLDRDLQ